MSGVSDFNWQIRSTVFRQLIQQGINHEIAYDAAMCAMSRAAEKPLQWEKPTPEQIERLMPNEEEE